MEGDLPSTLAMDTIYAQIDDSDTPTEIEKLYIAGLEFVGGGVPDTGEPTIVSPSNGSTLNLGENSGSGVSKTITVKGKNLTGDLTVAVGTGLTISYGQLTGQSSITIPKANALLGEQITIAYSGSGALADGSLVISSGNDVLSAVVVVVVVAPVFLTAVKTNGTQWLKTNYTPGPNTSLQFDFKVVANSGTASTTSANNNCQFLSAKTGTEKFIFQTGYGNANLYSLMVYTGTESAPMFNHEYGQATMGNVRSTLSYSNGSVTYLGQTGDLNTKAVSQAEPLAIGYSWGKDKCFDVFDLYIYGLKIYDNNTLVREYKPASLNGHVGLYDAVNNAFISSETNYELDAIS